MTNIRSDAPWHWESYDRFLGTTLPKLLGERLPLDGYHADRSGEFTASVTIAVAQGKNSAQVTFDDLPAPNQDGIFESDGRQFAVVPVASSEHLDTADIRCAGELLIDHISELLGRTPGSVDWDVALLTSWVPLDQWFQDFFQPQPGRRVRAIPLDVTNWLSVRAHLRRVLIDHFESSLAPGQRGLACPVECPEGPNLGHIVSVAVGAAIRDRRLVMVDEAPAAMLGLTASMIPLIEYDDNNRALMGANMMRQWLDPGDSEEALVQSGNEPDETTFWRGRNLLTAFISFGGDTYEDAIVMSQSAAGRFSGAGPVLVGDKISNRHGSKGVVGRIIPDADMPQLADGTSVELCFSFIGCHARLNPGQVREAVLGRIAKATGDVIIAPPFAGRSDDELRRMLENADLDKSAMEQLTLGAAGKAMSRRSTVGYVYWGQLFHRAIDKLKVFVGQERHQELGDMDFETLRDVGATALIHDFYQVQNVMGRPWEPLLSKVRTASAPAETETTPQFDALSERLSAMGISVRRGSRGLTFDQAAPVEDAISLVEPVTHPWISTQTLVSVGPVRGMTALFSDIESANDRLARLIDAESPVPLLAGARQRLQSAVAEYAEACLGPQHLKPRAEVLFSARSVIAPGTGFAHDQIGLPEQMAWGMFGPVIESEVGADAVAARDTVARAALDDAMRDSWVVMLRGPALLPTSALAFRPIAVSDSVIRVPLQALRLVNGDFDGDQVAVFLPLTEQAQSEAGRLLSIAGHLGNDPDFVLPLLVPRHEPMWALADISRQQGGVKRLSAEVGIELSVPDGIVTFASLQSDLVALAAARGPEAALDTIARMYAIGLDHAQASGASLSTFIADAEEPPPAPSGNDLPAWERYHLECEQRLVTRTDYDDPLIGPQLLAVRSGARGNAWQLRALASVFGLVADAAGHLVPAPGCVARGRSPEEFWNCAAGARKGLAEVVAQLQVRPVRDLPAGIQSESYAPLARAMRAGTPGVVFAHAAAVGETDPLTDLESRLFVGGGE